MCGISVLVNTNNLPVQTSLIGSMNNRITHRGPDSEGIYQGSKFALGHRRLSILDTSHLAHQPFQYKEYLIVYNGEIYNYKEIKEKLLRKGYSFKTCSDTEVILAAYDHWGEKCVARFEGMWSFIIYDPKKEILFGSRDRFGLKPFHYVSLPDFFVIGSEIKQFIEIPGFRPVLNEEVAFNFLNYSALNYSDETFFNGVQSLGAGHNMEYDLSTHRYSIRQWYYFPEHAVTKLDMQEAAEQFRQLFTTSVATRLNSDVRVGSCLSGGLDSSSIVCMANKIINGHDPLHTISICWDNKLIDEQEYIDIVTKHTGTINKKIFPNINQLNEEDLLEKIIYHQDQPIPTASHFAEFKVYEAARQNNLSVMLDGQGADEYLGGYGIFLWYHMHALLNQSKLISLSQEWNAVRKLSNFSDNQMLRTFLYFKYKHKRPQLSPIIDEHWAKGYLNGNPTLPPPHAGLSARQLSHHQLFCSSLPYQLHSADRNSMNHSVEARLPFLDHRLVEFCYSLPDTFKISKGMSKIILRQGLKTILPKEIYERKSKLGFPAPECEWLRSNGDWITKQIDEHSDVLEAFISPARLKEQFQHFSINGHQDSVPFFRILSFAKWLKIFNVSLAQVALVCL